MLNARIISVGDELFKGTVNTTATTMARELSRIGVNPARIVAVPDNLTEIVAEISVCASSKADILLITGGLGPTDDDATVKAVAHALGVPVISDPTHLRYLKSIQTSHNLPSQFLKQAEIPQTFTAKKSDFGSAPFIYRYHPRKNLGSQKSSISIPISLVVLLPGVPYECLGLFEQEVLPLVHRLKPQRSRGSQGSAEPTSFKNFEYMELKMIGVAEVVVEQALKNILANLPAEMNKKYRKEKATLRVAYLPNLGELLLRLRVEVEVRQGSQGGNGATFLRILIKRLQKTFSHQLSYTGKLNHPAPSVVEKLHRFFIQQRLKVGFIESCTGGLLTAAFVELPGSSAYLDAGIISYANDAKIHFAGVKPRTLEQHGAVSRETAMEMVRGIMRRHKLNLAVAITGIAGPGGGTKQKPVGLVYIAVRYQPESKPLAKSATNQIQEYILRLNLGTREAKGKKLSLYNVRTQIRKRAVKQALFMILKITSATK